MNGQHLFMAKAYATIYYIWQHDVKLIMMQLIYTTQLPLSVL